MSGSCVAVVDRLTEIHFIAHWVSPSLLARTASIRNKESHPGAQPLLLGITDDPKPGKCNIRYATSK
ncbi:hypothetical protein JMUB6875_44250 [Nocardia sp. JMUB6875]